MTMVETILFLMCLGISKVVVDFAEKIKNQQ